jgi:kynurenine formamidase
MNLNNFDIIDLTHPITSSMPQWPGDPKTAIDAVSKYSSDGFNLNNISIGEHTGTHIGAPNHFVENGSDVSFIPINRFFVPAIKINVTHKIQENHNYLVGIQDLLDWEKSYGKMQNNQLVLVQTNWSEKWSNPLAYFGRTNNKMNFPGVSEEAVDFLIANREIVAIGIDSPGIDGGDSKGYLVNKKLAKAGLYHLENLTNLEKLNLKNLYIFIGALPITGGTGSPCRIIAFQPKDKTY